MRQHHALFANFILRFGKKELIDYAETILIPALTDDTRKCSATITESGRRQL